MLVSLSVAGAAGAAASLEINYAAPITGSTRHTDVTLVETYGGGTFDDDGDRFYVIDYKPDGMRVAIHWKLKNGSRQGLCINKGYAYWYECNKDLPEHQTVLVRLGRCDGDVHSCEALGDYRDWTAYKSTSTS